MGLVPMKESESWLNSTATSATARGSIKGRASRQLGAVCPRIEGLAIQTFLCGGFT